MVTKHHFYVSSAARNGKEACQLATGKQFPNIYSARIDFVRYWIFIFIFLFGEMTSEPKIGHMSQDWT